MTPEIREKVRAVGELLKDSTNRTTGVYARDIAGYPVAPIHPEACEWCLDGAIAKVTSATVHGSLWIPAGDLYQKVYAAVGKIIVGQPLWAGEDDWDNPGPERRQEIVDLLLAVEP